MRRSSSPDGEVLSHRYNAGRNLSRITSDKQGAQTFYLESLECGAFEQRIAVRLGNGDSRTAGGWAFICLLSGAASAIVCSESSTGSA